MLGAIAAFIIDREFMKAAGFAMGAAAMTFFGFMHGEKIGLGQTPVVAVSYLAVGLLLVSCAKYAAVATEPVSEHLEAEHGAGIPASAA